MNFVLGRTSNLAIPDGTAYRFCQSEFSRHLKRSKDPLYIVIDGLDQISSSEARQILDLIPFGIDNARYIVTANNRGLEQYIEDKGLQLKPLSIPPFNKYEEAQYFSSSGLDEDLLHEIRQVYRGMPGKLNSVKRLLHNPSQKERIGNRFPEELYDLFSIEWRSVDTSDKDLQLILTLLAFDRKQHTLQSVAQILNLDPEFARLKLDQLHFVDVDTHTGICAFVTEEFGRFAMKRLSQYEQQALGAIITHLTRNGVTEESLIDLPIYYEQAKQWRELLAFLNPDNFGQLVGFCKSKTKIQEYAKRGLISALEVNNDGDILRFGMHMSTIEENLGSRVWRSEIEARIALGQYEQALALAHSTVINEDRLHLLAIIARKKKENNLPVESDLIDQIRSHYRTIDSGLGERGVEIACDLVHTCSDLAIDLVERSTRAHGGENALDWAFVSLSLSALEARESSEHELSSIDSRIKNPMAKKFSLAAHLLIEEYSADQVIAEAKKLDTTTDQLYLLRIWTRSNRRRTDATAVIDYALKLAVASREYAPNPSLYRELATPLPYIEDRDKARELVERFDRQIASIQHLGALEDIVQFQLQLAETEIQYDFASAKERILDVYLSFFEEADLSVRAGCLARLLSALARMNISSQLEESDGLQSLTSSELETTVANLLAATAEHNYATNSILESFSSVLPQMALDVAMGLNTEYRRDAAFSEIIENCLNVHFRRLNLRFLLECLGEISDPDVKATCVTNIVDRINADVDRLTDETDYAPYLQLITESDEIPDSRSRIEAYTKLYGILHKSGKDELEPIKREVLNKLQTSWTNMDLGWNRVNVGFNACSMMSEIDQRVSEEYMN